MNSNTLISVVIPTYNREATIARAVESALKQTWTDIEVIVIDDGSTDGTQEVVGAINDPRVRYLRNDRNLRGGASRNKGGRLARGEYIAFLDSDDEWLAGKLATQMEAVLERGNPKAVVCYTRLLVRRNGKEFMEPARGIGRGEQVGDYLFKNSGHIQTSSLFMSKELFESCLFDSRLLKHQDWDLAIRLQLIGAEFVFIESAETIWYQDTKTNRVSSLVDNDGSKEWIRRYGNHLSKGAIFGFMAIIIAPELANGPFPERVKAAGILIAALLLRAVSVRKFVVDFARIVIGRKVINSCKTAFCGVRGVLVK
ncbi:MULTISPECIES: glycosyltransferase family 2 protein [Paraburkholderia]|uniref:glycosyltransferase family 2 protein n=1 Tax=Paraburkholderia TaxID=1822464 RepID=UPI00224E1B6B|nr:MULTISPECIES: glycosyltransferase family 2 protein [Paraburkholderia]MCX4172736.1 glycosyltransferase family 2 protein [Paraburkholderia madseniana]MDQ6460744.1 glycosyltransferase [Paraburkholderia madseniana]